MKEKSCPITLSLLRNLPCGALERREFSEKGKSLSETLSYWTRESQYDIGVGSTKKNFLVFLIRNPISKRAHTQTLTSMVGTTSALRREHEQEFSSKMSF